MEVFQGGKPDRQRSTRSGAFYKASQQNLVTMVGQSLLRSRKTYYVVLRRPESGFGPAHQSRSYINPPGELALDRRDHNDSGHGHGDVTEHASLLQPRAATRGADGSSGSRRISGAQLLRSATVEGRRGGLLQIAVLLVVTTLFPWALAGRKPGSESWATN